MFYVSLGTQLLLFGAASLRAVMAAGEVKSVLFVCLGNICRSPIAEAVFRKLVTEENIQSKVTTDDFLTYDYILCMDENNLQDMKRKSNQIKNCKAKIELLGSYDPLKQLIIEDPYYGNDEDFETVYQQCLRCCKSFLENPH